MARQDWPSAAVAFSPALLAPASAAGEPGVLLAIDVGDVAGNTSTTVGTIDSCFAVSPGQTNITVDVVIINAINVSRAEFSIVSHSGLPFTISDRSVADSLLNNESPDLGGSAVIDAGRSHPIPDSDGAHVVSIFNNAFPVEGASGSGNLIRFTITAPTPAIPGLVHLILSGVFVGADVPLTTQGALLAVGLPCPTPTLGPSPTIVKVVADGDPSPIGGTLTPDGLADINDPGQVLFSAVSRGEGGGRNGIFLASGGVTHKVVAEGDPAPGGGAFSAVSRGGALNNSGEVAFGGEVAGGTSGIFVEGGGTIRRVVSVGQAGFTFFGGVDFNNVGDVLFQAAIGGSGHGLFLVRGGALLKVVAPGDPSPTGGAFLGASGVLNDFGQVAFHASISGGTGPEGVFMWSDGVVTKLVAFGDPSPFGGRFGGLCPCELNNEGEVAFHAGVNGGPGGVFVASTSRISKIALSSDPTPLGGTFSGAFFANLFGMNDLGEVSWAQRIRLTAGTTQAAIFLGSESKILKMLAAGDPSPIGGEFAEPVGARVNNKGQIAFWSYVFFGGENGIPLTLVPGVFMSLPLDETPPVITADQAPAPNAAGWNNTDVTVSWSVSDPESGIASSSGCGTTILTAETPGTTLTCSATNGVGLSRSASITVKIDKTPPFTNIPLSTNCPRLNGWFSCDVTVSLVVSEFLSGVASTEISLDGGGTFQPYGGSLVLSQDGSFTILGRSSDLAGNLESPAKSAVVRIDKTLPVITVNTPQPFAVLPVGTALDFGASDALSGLQSVVGHLDDGTATVDVSSGFVPGPGVYTLTVEATDLAGNVGSETRFFVIYDATAGFATGGGWIIPGSSTSELGDMLPGLDGTSPAEFGFVVKYKPGASTPDGQLEFQYRQGNFNLHSSGMEWLVIVNTNWAKFKGTATIKGLDGIFPFRVDARDGNLNGGNQTDRFIIRIWAPGANPDLDEPIYKASGDLQGGQVVIHTK